MRIGDHDLGAAELEVLKVLWDLGPVNVRRVLDDLHGRGRRVAYTTVQTMLTRLEQKGFVRRDKRGTAHVYRAAISRERISTWRLDRLMQQLYDGAAGPLVLQLVQSGRLKPEEIDELQRLIERLDGQGPSASA